MACLLTRGWSEWWRTSATASAAELWFGPWGKTAPQFPVPRCIATGKACVANDRLLRRRGTDEGREEVGPGPAPAAPPQLRATGPGQAGTPTPGRACSHCGPTQLRQADVLRVPLGAWTRAITPLPDELFRICYMLDVRFPPAMRHAAGPH